MCRGYNTGFGRAGARPKVIGEARAVEVGTQPFWQSGAAAGVEGAAVGTARAHEATLFAPGLQHLAHEVLQASTSL